MPYNHKRPSVYVAGSVREVPRVQAVQEELRKLNFTINFDWTKFEGDGEIPEDRDPWFWKNNRERGRDLAETEVSAACNANYVVVLAPNPPGKGMGCWLEMGCALAHGVKVILVNPWRDSPFWYHRFVTVVDTEEELLAVMEKEWLAYVDRATGEAEETGISLMTLFSEKSPADAVEICGEMFVWSWDDENTLYIQTYADGIVAYRSTREKVESAVFDPVTSCWILEMESCDTYPYPTGVVWDQMHPYHLDFRATTRVVGPPSIEEDDDATCSECGAPTDDGEGWDGKCGNCADREADEEE